MTKDYHDGFIEDYDKGFNQGTTLVSITIIVLTLIYLLIMTPSVQDPIQAYLDKQKTIQNYNSVTSNTQTEN